MDFTRDVNIELMRTHHKGVLMGWQEALDAVHALIKTHAERYETEQEKNVCKNISCIIENLKDVNFKIGE